MRKSVRWLLLILAIGMMVFIFVMSSHNAADSTEESRGIARLIGQIFIRDFDKWDAEDQLDFVKSIDGTVRKVGHFAEYAALGGMLYLVLFSWGMKPHAALSVSFGAGVLYAVTDEVHQLFIDGRSLEFSDIVIDAAGTAVGCLLVYAIVTTVKGRREKRGVKATEQ